MNQKQWLGITTLLILVGLSLTAWSFYGDPPPATPPAVPTGQSTSPEPASEPTPAQPGADWTEEQIKTFAIAAHDRVVQVFYVQNPDWLRNHGLTPVPITRREDVENLLKGYCTEGYIDWIWQEGNHGGAMPFGFYMDGFPRLADLPAIWIDRLAPDKIALGGAIEYEDEDLPREITVVLLSLTPEGWRIDRNPEILMDMYEKHYNIPRE